ncbi:MAG TPA: hypothetical protein VKT73_11355 [Xanthobacteraceae bacterium]|nr:hypothetical protein [Xanthobacteraceae bacterium]
MHPILIRSKAGDAGPFSAPGHPALARRFHFWRGASGHRYACSVFAPEAAPAFDGFVALFVRREGDKRDVIAVDVALDPARLPADCNEIHLHLAGEDQALADIYRDLSALAGPPRAVGTFSDLPVYAIGKGLEPRGRVKLGAYALYKRAANHSNVASRMPSASSSFTVAST